MLRLKLKLEISDVNTPSAKNRRQKSKKTLKADSAKQAINRKTSESQIFKEAYIKGHHIYYVTRAKYITAKTLN
jgi:hypothetical protein